MISFLYPRLKEVTINLGIFLSQKMNGVEAAHRLPQNPYCSPGLFIGALGYSMSGAGKGADASWLKSLAPGTLTITGSYLAGFFIGWGARRAIKLTSIITALAVAATGALVWLGWDMSAVQSWLNSASAWAGKNIERVGRYLVSLLPSASAAGVGGVLGFKKK